MNKAAQAAACVAAAATMLLAADAAAEPRSPTQDTLAARGMPLHAARCVASRRWDRQSQIPLAPSPQRESTSRASTGPTDLNLSPAYAQTIWPSGHRDSANSDYVPVVIARDRFVKTRLLRGHPIFWAPTTGLDGALYVTTGKGPGHSNLFALSSDGRILWQSAPQETLDDLDSYAIINAAVVDAGGDIYVGDADQLWAFRPGGAVKWAAKLTPFGVDHGFMSVIVSKQGYVGGISSNGKVIFFHPEDGTPALPVLDLPGGPGPPAQDTPPASLWKDLMDPGLKDFMFNLIQGWEMEVANTPAVHPDSGRIYITAAGVEPGSGLLYGIDVDDDGLRIAFQTPMGGGSGSSPAISPDGRQVYALDEAGHMVAVDAYSGAKLWETAEGGGGSASPSVGPDGTVYTAFQDHILAFHADGTLAWQRYYNDFAAAEVPPLDGAWSLLLSGPAAFVNSLIVVGEREAWVNIVCGYHLRLLPSGNNRTRVPVPLRSTLVAIDLADGKPLGEPLTIPETSEGFVVPTVDGNAYATLSGAISSIFYNLLNPLLPRRFEVPNEPEAGLLLLEPRSYRGLARDGLEQIASRCEESARAARAGRAPEAAAALRSVALQTESTAAVIARAAEHGEITGALAQELRRRIGLLAGGRRALAAKLDGAGAASPAAGGTGLELEAMRDAFVALRESLD